MNLTISFHSLRCFLNHRKESHEGVNMQTTRGNLDVVSKYILHELLQSKLNSMQIRCLFASKVAL